MHLDYLDRPLSLSIVTMLNRDLKWLLHRVRDPNICADVLDSGDFQQLLLDPLVDPKTDIFLYGSDDGAQTTNGKHSRDWTCWFSAYR